jgi:hypothetical protein
MPAFQPFRILDTSFLVDLSDTPSSRSNQQKHSCKGMPPKLTSVRDCLSSRDQLTIHAVAHGQEPQETLFAADARDSARREWSLRSTSAASSMPNS